MIKKSLYIFIILSLGFQAPVYSQDFDSKLDAEAAELFGDDSAFEQPSLENPDNQNLSPDSSSSDKRKSKRATSAKRKKSAAKKKPKAQKKPVANKSRRRQKSKNNAAKKSRRRKAQRRLASDEADIAAFEKSVTKVAMPPRNDNRRIKKLSLSEAIELALENNLSLKTSEITFKQASNNYKLSRYNYYYPIGSVAITGSDANGDDTLAETDATSSTLALSWSGTLPSSGISYTLTPVSLSDSVAGGIASHGFSSSVSLSLPLWQNFGPYANPLTIQNARLTLLISKHSKDATFISTVNSIKTAYWDLLLNLQQLEIQRASVKSALNIVKETKEKIRLGLIAQLEIFNALSNFYSAQSSFYETESSTSQQQDAFKQLLGIDDEDGDLWFEPNDDVGELAKKVKPPNFNKKELAATARKQKPDYLSSKKSLELSKNSLESARLAKFPNVALTTSFTQSGTAASGYDDAFENAHDKARTQNTTVGLTFTWNFPNISNDTAYRNAVLDLTSQEATFRNEEIQLRNDITAAVNQIEASYRRIKVAELAKENALKTYKAELVKYKLGQTTQKNVIDFQQSLSNSQINEIEAVTNYEKALISLDGVVGRTSTR